MLGLESFRRGPFKRIQALVVRDDASIDAVWHWSLHLYSWLRPPSLEYPSNRRHFWFHLGGKSCCALLLSAVWIEDRQAGLAWLAYVGTPRVVTTRHLAPRNSLSLLSSGCCRRCVLLVVVVLICYWLGDIIRSFVAISEISLVISDVDLDIFLIFDKKPP